MNNYAWMANNVPLKHCTQLLHWQKKLKCLQGTKLQQEAKKSVSGGVKLLCFRFMKGHLRIIKPVHQNPQPTFSYGTCGQISPSKHHIGHSHCVCISVPRSDQKIREEVNLEWALITPRTEEINLCLRHTWKHISLHTSTVTETLLCFRSPLLKLPLYFFYCCHGFCIEASREKLPVPITIRRQ